MRIGKLDKMATVQSSVATVGEMGGHSLAWSTVKERWCSAVSRAGTETGEGGKLVARHYWTVRMRYDPDITPEHRLIVSGRILQIQSVSGLSERDDYIELLCTETKD